MENRARGIPRPPEPERGTAAASRPSKGAWGTSPMSKLKDKVAVVTGASKGIGASIAGHLAAEGAAVVVNYVSSRADAERVVAEITRAGGRAIAVQADVAPQGHVTRVFAERVKGLGRVDVLGNKTGVY